ncbi:hypothetical protein ALT1644_120055 [Alteromonas macleodii]|uniref:Uncharacterized protein n=1 Tax=marine sediment metagenome TaxID=412755 RepID=A0A1B6NT28_9ZZZZ
MALCSFNLELKISHILTLNLYLITLKLKNYSIHLINDKKLINFTLN